MTCNPLCIPTLYFGMASKNRFIRRCSLMMYSSQNKNIFICRLCTAFLRRVPTKTDKTRQTKSEAFLLFFYTYAYKCGHSIFRSNIEAKVGTRHRMAVKNGHNSIFHSIVKTKVGAIHRMSKRLTQNQQKEDLLPEGNRPPKRYGTGKRLSITLLRKAVLRMSGTASTLLRSQARVCRSLHGVRPLQGSSRP